MSNSPYDKGYFDDDNGQEEQEDIPIVNWQPFQEMNILTPLERMRMDSLNKTRDPQKITQAVMENSREYVELFIKLLFNIHQADKLKYVLQLVDILFDNSKRFLEDFHGATKLNVSPYTPFLRLLIKNEPYILEKSVRALSLLFSLDNELHQNELTSFLEAITTQLQQAEKDERKARMCVHALMVLLKKDDTRPLFYKAKGVPALINLLKCYSRDEQMLYEVVLCLWLLSFNKNAFDFFQNENLAPRLHEILKTQQKEKVIRVTIATLKNLIKKSNKVINDLIHVSVPRTLANLSKRSFTDKDIVDDLKVLTEALETHIDEISSFDEYRQEVLSGHLEWSPVHTSEKFWKESLTKFEQNNFHILRELINLLDSEVAQTKAIACHDLGQFVRFYPRGKRLIEDFGAKVKIIELMDYQNEEVRKHALLCTQKIMIQNWEMLNLGD